MYLALRHKLSLPPQPRSTDVPSTDA